MLHTETPTREVERKAPLRDSKRIGKVELCKELGWSRPKLDRRLDSDPRFPVVYRGGDGQGRGWGFDLEAVQAYLRNQPESEPSSDAMPDSGAQRHPSGEHRGFAVDPDVTPFDSDLRGKHYGEETAKQRLVMAQAAMQEDKLRKARGDLVQADDLRTAIFAMFMHLTKGLDSLPDRIVQHLNLPAEQSLTIREQINQLRVSLHDDIRQLLQSNA